MKTVEQGLNEAYKQAGENAYFGNGFKAGIEFAQRWISVDDELPHCWESGDWDGLRSDFVIIKNDDGSLDICKLYSGILDGVEFNDFADTYGYVLARVAHWRPIEIK